MSNIHVTSEIGTLRKVLLHRPGNELLNLTPDTLSELLFDDIPFLPNAQKEHDAFARALAANGVQVVYLEDLVADVLGGSDEVRSKFLKQFIVEAGIDTAKYQEMTYNYLDQIKDPKKLVLKLMAGIQLSELPKSERNNEKSLVDLCDDPDRFIAKPMPNLYFTRDNFASVGTGINLNHMYSETRNRECIFAEYVFKYHPEYKDTPKYYNRSYNWRIEGGDVLNINEHVVAIGISQRTETAAIDQVAKNFFNDATCKIDTVLAFNIPVSRAFMHLDTVFTQIDTDAFTIHPGIMGTLQVFALTADRANHDVHIEEHTGKLEDILAKFMGLDKVRLFPCGAGDPLAAEREQWNDGSNTLTIAPGKIIVYKRNYVTNQYLKDNGFEVLELEASNLCVGRGGPRCMSMPLVRED